MPKFTGASEKAMNDWLKRGNGQGKGPDYHPMLRVQDVPSRGLSRKFLGLKTRGFTTPFPIWSTTRPSIMRPTLRCSISGSSSHCHGKTPLKSQPSMTSSIPVYPRYRTPIVMTTDFVVTLNDAEKTSKAVAVKPFAEIDPENPRAGRTWDKLFIEKVFWNKRGIDWQVQTERDFSVTRAINLSILRPTMVPPELSYLDDHMPDFVEQFRANWKVYRTLNEIHEIVGGRLHLDLYECFCLFGRSVWQRQLPIDLTEELVGHNFPVTLNKKEMPMISINDVVMPVPFAMRRSVHQPISGRRRKRYGRFDSNRQRLHHWSFQTAV